MLLTSGVADGTTGTANIGQAGVTPDDPNDPAFLGLPVTFFFKEIPHGLPALQSNVIMTISDTVFLHNPIGIYQVVPEPASLLITTIGAVILLGVRIGRQRLRSIGAR